METANIVTELSAAEQSVSPEHNETSEDVGMDLMHAFNDQGLELKNQILSNMINASMDDALTSLSPVTVLSQDLAAAMYERKSNHGQADYEKGLMTSGLSPDVFDFFYKLNTLFNLQYSLDDELKNLFSLMLEAKTHEVSLDDQQKCVVALTSLIKEKLAFIRNFLTHPVQQLVVMMMHDILFGSENKNILSIGSNRTVDYLKDTCCFAEPFFFEFSTPINVKKEIDRARLSDFEKGDNYVHAIVDEDGSLLACLKINAGIRTALTTEPFVLDGVEIPVGSLIALHFSQSHASKTVDHPVFREVSKISAVQGMEFLRLSTLAVDPDKRKSAFPNETRGYENRLCVNYSWIETKHFVEMWNRR